jgi:hypothetical protein
MTLIIHIHSVLGMDPAVYQLACICELLFKSPVNVLQLMALTCREPVDKDKVFACPCGILRNCVHNLMLGFMCIGRCCVS